MVRAAATIAVPASLAATAVFAAQPYVTDDARILAPDTCQFEAGKQGGPGGGEVWLLPACNLYADTEITVGLTRFTNAPRRYVVQGKGLWRPYAEGRTGYGWVAGVEAGSRANSRAISRYYTSFLASRAFDRERLSVHLNFGFARDQDERRNTATWATAAEYALLPRVAVIAELYGENHGHPFHQAGVRLAFVPDRLEFDVTAGGRNGERGTTRFWAVGLRYITGP